MKAASRPTVNEYPRMLDRHTGAAYCGMGVTYFRQWADSIGATRKFGRIVRFDKKIIDAALDAATANPVQVG